MPRTPPVERPTLGIYPGEVLKDDPYKDHVRVVVALRPGHRWVHEVHHVPVAQMEAWRVPGDHPGNLGSNISAKEALKTLTENTKEIGASIRRYIFSCRGSPATAGKTSVCEVETALRELNKRAIQAKKLKAPLELLVLSSDASIPWELGFVPGTQNIALSDRFAVAKLLIGHPHKVPVVRPKPLKILVEVRPSYQPFGNEHEAELPEGFQESLRGLRRTIDHINDFHSSTATIDWIEGVDEIFSDVREKIAKGNYGLVVFIGRYDASKSAILHHRSGKEDQFIQLSHIDLGKKLPLYFLDACHTSVQARPHDPHGPITTAFRRGACAVVGACHVIHVNVAHVFARFFLDQLIHGNASIARAVHLAGQSTRRHFRGGTMNDKVRAKESSLFSVTGRDIESLFSVPGLRGDRRLSVLWPQRKQKYYSVLARGVSPPKGITELYPDGPLPECEIEARLKKEAEVPPARKDLPIAADMAIPQAAQLMAERPGEFVIVGCMCVPITDDCGLVIDGNIDVLKKKGARIVSAGAHLSVTNFCRIWLGIKEIDPIKHKVTLLTGWPYDKIEVNLMRFLRDHGPGSLPNAGWVLAAEAKFAVDQALKTLGNSIHMEPLRTPVVEFLESEYTVGDEGLSLPSTVIVARRDDVLADPGLYFTYLEVMHDMLRKEWESLQYDVRENLYSASEIPPQPTPLSEVHKLQVFLSEEAIRGILAFTHYLATSGLRSLEDVDTTPLLSTGLTLADFFPLSPYSKWWNTKKIETIRAKLKKDIKDYAKTTAGAIREARNYVNLVRDKRPDAWFTKRDREIECFREEMLEICRLLAAERKQSDTRNALNSIAVRLRFAKSREALFRKRIRGD